MKSPGHQQHPDHKVAERRLSEKAEAQLAGQRLAATEDVIRVEEDGNPPRLYFARSAVAMDKLEPSTTTTRCPFKGTARYFNLKQDGRCFPDAAWSYEDPYEEHQALKGRVAFYDDKYKEIEVRLSP